MGYNRESYIQVQKDNSTTHIIGDPEVGVRTRGKPKVNYREMVGYMCYTSFVEPKNIKEALEDE